MSNRSNAIKYGGGYGNVGRSRRPSPTPGGYGTTGGISIDPVTGDPVYSPMTVGHPVLDRIFNRGGASAAASQYNNAVMQMMLMDAMQRKSRLAEVSASGEEQRKTQREGAEQQKSIFTRQQILNIMKEAGVPYTDENFKVFDKALSDQRIRNALTTDVNKDRVLTNPGFQEAQVEGATAAARQPVFGNVLAVPADTDVYAPSNIFASPPSVAAGRTVQQGMVESAPTEYNGMQMPGKPFAVRQVTPGSFKPAANPALFDAAIQQGQQQPGQPTTQPSVNPDYNAKAADFMQQFNFGPPGITNEQLLSDPNVLMMILGNRAFGR